MQFFLSLTYNVQSKHHLPKSLPPFTRMFSDDTASYISNTGEIFVDSWPRVFQVYDNDMTN